MPSSGPPDFTGKDTPATGAPSPGKAAGRTGGESQNVGDHVTEVDAPQAALNRMRAVAKSRGELRIARSRLGEKPAAKKKRQPFMDTKDGGRDPLGLGKVVSRLVSDRGWSSPVAIGSVMAQWNTLVGPDIAAHCQPESFEGTTLHVRCDSTSWATQLRLLASSLLARFDAELGAGVVTKFQVLGPVAPSWRKGYRTVKGRGPRDTYG